MQSNVDRWLWAFLALLCLAAASPSRAGTSGWPDLSTPAPAEGGGEGDAAVIVGIEDYAWVQDVPGAAANANDWYSYLTGTRGVPVGHVALLRDADASREEILKRVGDALDKVSADGTLWFIFIGHGAPSPEGRDGILVGMDTRQTADSIYARGIRQSKLLGTLEAGPQRNTLVILDACFSGQDAAGGALVPGLQPLIPDYGEAGPSSATVVTAGRADQFAGPLPGTDRPAFSYLLLGGLRGWAERPEGAPITLQAAVDYTQTVLFAMVHGRSQTPQIRGPGADLVLSHGTEPGPSLTELVLGQPGGSSAPGPSIGETSLGSDTDLTALAEVVQERIDAENKLREAQEAQLQALADALAEEAAVEWIAIAPLLERDDEHARSLANAYLEKYEGARVTVADRSRAVDIPHLDDARRAASPPSPLTTTEARALSCRTTAADLGLSTGQPTLLSCPAGCRDGFAIWGTSVYTNDSSICAASIHAGTIPDAGGFLELTMLPGQESYVASERYGIRSGEWGRWNSSFRTDAVGAARTTSPTETDPVDTDGEAVVDDAGAVAPLDPGPAVVRITAPDYAYLELERVGDSRDGAQCTAPCKLSVSPGHWNVRVSNRRYTHYEQVSLQTGKYRLHADLWSEADMGFCIFMGVLGTLIYASGATLLVYTGVMNEDEDHVWPAPDTFQHQMGASIGMLAGGLTMSITFFGSSDGNTLFNLQKIP